MNRGPKFTPHPKSAAGDFYVESGQCGSCGMPHVVAPDLVGRTDEKISHCFWKKQPKTPAEVARAIAVLETQELGCHRYAGTDPAILERVPSGCCDYPIESPISLPPTASVPQHFMLLGDRPDLQPPRFGLLDSRPSLLARVWKSIRG
jgi:hypothetical protein